MLLRPYTPIWKNDFNKLREIIMSVLPSIQIKLEHVGSTSVQDLAAKPIIDMDLVFYNLEDFEAIRAGLEKLGYYHNGDQGIKGREAFRRHGTVEQHPVLDSISHYLYVCHTSSEELRRHLAFRDYLRKNKEARVAYEMVKQEIAEKAHQDRKVYADLKEEMAREFIESILQKANE